MRPTWESLTDAERALIEEAEKHDPNYPRNVMLFIHTFCLISGGELTETGLRIIGERDAK